MIATAADIALLITAICGGAAVLIGAVAGAVALLKVPKVLRATHALAAQIDHAVNGKPIGEPSIAVQVDAATGVLPLVQKIAADVEEIKRKP